MKKKAKSLSPEGEEKRKLLPNIIKSTKPIRKIRFVEGFVVEEVIGPEEEERRRQEEEENRKREEFEKRLEEEVNEKVKIALEEQKSKLTAQFEQEKKETYTQGFNDGKEEGIKEGKDEIRPLIDDFLSISKKISDEKELVIHEAEKEVITLCYLITKKIIKKEIEKDDKVILTIIKESLEFISDETDLVLKLNPEDYNVIKEYEKELISKLKDVKNFKIESDDKITRGGCLLETNSGEVDARLEAKLNELERVLLEDKKLGV